MAVAEVYRSFVELAAFGELPALKPNPEDPFWPEEINADVIAAADAGCEQALRCYADLAGFDLYPYDAAEGLRHLRRLFPPTTEGWIELRSRTDKPHRYWLRPADLNDVDAVADLATWVTRLNAKRAPVWVGIAPRKSTKDGSITNLAPCRWLWIDLDYKDIRGGATEVDRRVGLFQPQPTFVVETGGGRHLYWECDQPHESRDEWANRLKALTQKLGSDPHCTDCTRVLRLAGTWNGKFDPPVPVVMTEYVLF
jgi:hypothetical protein